MSRIIAIVEDEPTIRANYTDALKRYGYEVHGYPDRPSAERAFAARLPDLVLIDVGLGDEPEGGFELCRGLRSRSATLPIVFLSARDNDFDIISGLRLGADDYLSKDVSLQQLLARIVTLFRRVEALRQPVGKEEILEHGPLKLEVDSMRVFWNNQAVELTVTEFWIVHAMARYPGHVKNRDQLMSAAQVVVDESTITSHIKRIRKKFVAMDGEFDAIDTLHGVGYRWKS
jgi:two-component system, OmpR family, response regulator